VYAKCLAPDIEYKTVSVLERISSRELVLLLLSKYRNTQIKQNIERGGKRQEKEILIHIRPNVLFLLSLHI
jgi:hypothetical protein